MRQTEMDYLEPEEEMDLIYKECGDDSIRLRKILPWKGVYRGSRPGYPRKVVPKHSLDTAIKAIRKNKINTVVCLLTDGEAYKYYGLDLVRYYRRNAGLKVLRYPIPDFGTPRVSFMFDMCLTVRVLLFSGSRVLFHCSAGVGRTSLALNCFSAYRTVYLDEDLIDWGGSETLEQQNFIQMFRAHVKQKGKAATKKIGGGKK